MSDRRFLSIVALTALLAIIVFWLPTIPSSSEQIQFGMTREEVDAIMGQPGKVMDGRVSWFDGASVSVRFDAQGRVLYKFQGARRMAVYDYLKFKLGWR